MNDVYYITHRRFRGVALCGKKMNLPHGTALRQLGAWLFTLDGQLVCAATSENAKQHFAWDEDGLGLLRGKLTHAIAYSRRERTVDMPGGTKRRQRFTAEEIDMLERDYGAFLRHDAPVILFNDSFFTADVQTLRRLADALGLKV